jgi:hypothetical protein
MGIRLKAAVTGATGKTKHFVGVLVERKPLPRDQRSGVRSCSGIPKNRRSDRLSANRHAIPH